MFGRISFAVLKTTLHCVGSSLTLLSVGIPALPSWEDSSAQKMDPVGHHWYPDRHQPDRHSSNLCAVRPSFPCSLVVGRCIDWKALSGLGCRNDHRIRPKCIELALRHHAYYRTGLHFMGPPNATTAEGYPCSRPDVKHLRFRGINC